MRVGCSERRPSWVISFKSRSVPRTSTGLPPSMPTSSASSRSRRSIPRAWCSSTSTESASFSTAARAPSLIYLRVDDIDATVEKLRATGSAIEGEPHVIFSHTDDTLGPAGTDEWMAFFRDSEGNLVGLVEQRPAA